MTYGNSNIIVSAVFLILLKILFKDKDGSGQNEGSHGVEHEDLFKEEPEFDRTWSFLPNNIFHRSDDD